MGNCLITKPTFKLCGLDTSTYTSINSGYIATEDCWVYWEAESEGSASTGEAWVKVDNVQVGRVYCWSTSRGSTIIPLKKGQTITVGGTNRFNNLYKMSLKLI